MIIRKLFKYEMSHRVVDAYTKRCAENIHGHSYKLELFFRGDTPDAAQMLMDFSLVKKHIHPFVDSFDHSHMVWKKPGMEEEIEYVKKHNKRYILAPFSSTAEMQAKMFWWYSAHILRDYNVVAHAARVHETDTGYAEYGLADIKNCNFPSVLINNIEFSDGIKEEWPREFQDSYKTLLYKENNI